MARRGRPAREPTQEERRRVKSLTAQGMSRKAVAEAIGRSAPNLRKFFAAELTAEKKSQIPAEIRASVSLMAACGEPLHLIAKAIGVSDLELEEDFADDLEAGAARYRLAMLERLDRQARLGSVSAIKQLVTMTQAESEAAAAPGAPVGKKAAAEAQAKEAVAAGGRFAPRAAPRLAAVNGKTVGDG